MKSFLRNLFKDSKPKINLTEKNQILVLGDSHSRAFSFNENFFPVFLGAGKKINFASEENFQEVMKSTRNVLKAIDVDNILLYLGEPDTRYYLGKGWYPWDPKEEVEIDLDDAIESSMNRYAKFLDSFSSKQRVFVMNVTPSKRVEQNRIVDKYNEGLKKLCLEKGVDYLDINEDIYSHDQDVIKEKFYSDHVHLDLSIQELVEEILLEKKIIHEKLYNSNKHFTNKEVKDLYNYDKRFGCYVLK